MICTTVINYVVQQVTNPVDQWVDSLEEQCEELPWWNPLGWFCWFVVVTVKVTIWVVENIVVAVSTVQCTIVAWVVGFFLLLIALFPAALGQNWGMWDWTIHWFYTPARITFKSSSPSTSQPGYTDYTFRCNCKDKNKAQDVVITAMNDEEARRKAIEECERACA